MTSEIMSAFFEFEQSGWVNASNHLLTSWAMATRDVNLQRFSMQMLIFWAVSPACMAINIIPIPYAMRRSFGVGFAIRTTEHRMLIRANLCEQESYELVYDPPFLCSYQTTEVIVSDRSQLPPRFIWRAVFAENHF